MEELLDQEELAEIDRLARKQADCLGRLSEKDPVREAIHVGLFVCLLLAIFSLTAGLTMRTTTVEADVSRISWVIVAFTAVSAGVVYFSISYNQSSWHKRYLEAYQFTQRDFEYRKNYRREAKQRIDDFFEKQKRHLDEKKRYDH